VYGEGVVILGANGATILAERAVQAQATGQVLAQTGSSPAPIWLAGVASLVSGAFALTFQRRRHLSRYTLRSPKRS
jgi:LPXTG-motif cell wall-anchored protein